MSDQPKYAIVPVDMTEDMQLRTDLYTEDYTCLLDHAPAPPDIVGALEEAREVVARNAALDLHPTMAGKLDGILYRIDAALDQWYGRNGSES
jgi:hypothetical protein